jgi:aminopeptidase N
LRWQLLRRLAETGRAGDAAIAAELARDDTDSGNREAIACRAAIPDAEHKAAAWELLTGTAEISAGLLYSVASAFHQPEQASLLAPYAQRYFDVLPEIWATSGGHMQLARAEALFPVTAASAALIAQVDAFLTAQEREAGLVRVLIERRDEVEQALRSRALR